MGADCCAWCDCLKEVGDAGTVTAGYPAKNICHCLEVLGHIKATPNLGAPFTTPIGGIEVVNPAAFNCPRCVEFAGQFNNATQGHSACFATTICPNCTSMSIWYSNFGVSCFSPPSGSAPGLYVTVPGCTSTLGISSISPSILCGAGSVTIPGNRNLGCVPPSGAIPFSIAGLHSVTLDIPCNCECGSYGYNGDPAAIDPKIKCFADCCPDCECGCVDNYPCVDYTGTYFIQQLSNSLNLKYINQNGTINSNNYAKFKNALNQVEQFYSIDGEINWSKFKNDLKISGKKLNEFKSNMIKVQSMDNVEYANLFSSNEYESKKALNEALAEFSKPVILKPQSNIEENENGIITTTTFVPVEANETKQKEDCGCNKKQIEPKNRPVNKKRIL